MTSSSLLRMFIRNVIKRFLLHKKRTAANPSDILTEVCGISTYYAQKLYEGKLAIKEADRLVFHEKLKPLLSSGKVKGPHEADVLLRLLRGEFVTEQDVKVSNSEVPMAKLTFISIGNKQEDVTTPSWTLRTVFTTNADMDLFQKHIDKCDFTDFEKILVDELRQKGSVECREEFREAVGVSFTRTGITSQLNAINNKLKAQSQSATVCKPGDTYRFLIAGKVQAKHTPVQRKMYCLKKIIYIEKRHRKAA